MIAIIDYGVGNIKAFANIYHNLHIPFKIVKMKNELSGISKIILPGVGSFDHAMQSLQDSGMREKLDELVLEKKIPVIGICVGMQILAKSSDEGTLAGLGWIDAEVKKFDATKLDGNPLPHMGWNSIEIEKENQLLKNLEQNPRFYFLHSYYFLSNENDFILARTTYGEKFSSVVNFENIYGIQCHPEKSHHNGMKLLKNFGEL